MYIIIDNRKIKVVVANTLLKKLKGLTNKKNIKKGLLIPKANHIHTFFMLDNIDVLFINNKNAVIYKYQNMPPRRTFKVFEDITKTSVLELPKNTSQNIRIGDVLSFENE